MKQRNKWFWVFFVIFVIAVGVGAGYYFGQKDREQVYEDLAEENKKPQEETKQEEQTTDEPAEEEKTVEIPIDFSSLKEKNSEVYAWIRIPDTQVDYPILQRASDDLYYLDHTIDGAEGLPGSIYTQSLNAQDFSDKNTVIYGHNMRDETMFGGLKSYMDESYMKAHSQILIYTPEHILTYQVFAAVTYDNRHILNSFDFESEEGFQEYLDSLKEVRNMSSYIDSDVKATTDEIKPEAVVTEPEETAETAQENQELTFTSPMKGKVLPVTESADEMFASKMLGDGIAVEAADGTFYAPCDGTVSLLFPTKHAVGIKSADGVELLIHVGINTVQLDGEGFEAFVTQGDTVKKGDKLLKADLDFIREKGLNPQTMMIFPEAMNLDITPLSSENADENTAAVKVTRK